VDRNGFAEIMGKAGKMFWAGHSKEFPRDQSAMADERLE